MGSSAPPPELIGRILRHERAIVVIGIALLAGLCWWYLVAGAGMGAEPMTHMAARPPLGALVTMWWLMMLAMMLPSAAPAILLYAHVRRQRAREGAVVQPWIFAAGYALVWLAFSLAAAAVQSRVTFADPRLAGPLLIAAGAYQLSPFKNACLRQCQSPARFLSRHWRPGVAGALRLGALHGAYCVGCCWMLMALLFVGGVMNFAWIAGLTLIVGIEKLAPGGQWIGRIAGIALIGWGVARLIA